MEYGYVRVSTKEQRRMIALREFGIDTKESTWISKCIFTMCVCCTPTFYFTQQMYGNVRTLVI